MAKEIFVLPLLDTLFTNNHFKLVKGILNSHKEVIIFLLLDSADKTISCEDRMNIAQLYFNEEELSRLRFIKTLLKGDDNIISLVNEICLLTDEKKNNLHLVIDLKYSPNSPLKREFIDFIDQSNIKVLYYCHTKAQLFDVKDEELITKDPIIPANIDDLLSYNVNLNVFSYIIDHNLLFMDKIKRFIEGHRLKHSISVGKLCYKVAVNNNIKTPYRYFICGLLHDIAKHYDDVETKKIMQKHYKEYLDLPDYSYHQFLGEYTCIKEFKINDSEILDAIKYHCTGKPEMSLMAKILYACDKIDPLRGYDSSSMINAMLKNAESGFVYVLSENLIFLKKQTGLELDQFDRLSRQCYKYYLK